MGELFFYFWRQKADISCGKGVSWIGRRNDKEAYEHQCRHHQDNAPIKVLYIFSLPHTVTILDNKFTCPYPIHQDWSQNRARTRARAPMLEIHLPTVSSTNDYAKEKIETFPQEKIVCIWADHQLSGRGQYGRIWQSPPKTNLLVTFCLYSEAEPLFMTRMMAEACLKVLEKWGIMAQIKWPNDLLVDGKKIAGILTETKEGWVIIGLGLNVNMDEEMAKKIDQPVTSIFLEIKQKKDLKIVLSLLKQEIVKSLGYQD